MKRVLRFGSRKSALAVAQTNLIIEKVRKAHPGFDVELVTMDTTGDRNMKPFSEASDKFGIKGLFTQELEEALIDGRIDVAVHSLKDVPMYQNEVLPIVAYSHRGDPRDVMVLPADREEMGREAIGCASLRRCLQIKKIYPNLQVEPVRGNVITRLKKLDEHQYSGLILAAAGLFRLGLEGRIARYLSPDEVVPAPGQGVLACQGRKGEDYSWLDVIRDKDTDMCVTAERTFSAALGGGCTSPVGAYAEIESGVLTLRGFYSDPEGSFYRKDKICGAPGEAKELALTLAAKLSGEA